MQSRWRHTLSRSSGVGMSVTPPGWKSKDHDAINLDDDIAPGGVSFHHSFQSDLAEHGAFPVLQYVVGSFHEMEAVSIILIAAGWIGQVYDARRTLFLGWLALLFWFVVHVVHLLCRAPWSV